MTTTYANNNQSIGSGGLPMWLTILLGLATLLTYLMGYGPGAGKCAPSAPVAVVAPAPAVTVAPTPVAPAVPAPVVEPVAAAPAVAATPAAITPPAANVYFGLDKTNLPANTDKTLVQIVDFLKTNGNYKASVSGYHDPSGDKAHNEDLAKNRALGVRGALENAGIAADRIVMQKPTETTGSGKPQEARRVEVTVQP
jgi:K(+)-stimulated pyrophosphate-energized sodium pump